MTSQLEAVIASNAITEPEYRIPTEGLEIEGARILYFNKIMERVKGENYAVWVVMAQRDHELHPFVVWNLIAGANGFMYERGDYFADELDAISKYQDRAF